MSMSNFSFPMGIRDSASSPASTTLASSTNHQTTRGLSNAVDSLGLRSPKNKHKRTTTSISYSGLTPLADATGALNPSAHPTRPATFMRHMRRVSSSFPRSSGMKRSSESDDARTEPSSVKSPRLPIPFQFMSPKEETDFVPMSSAEFHVGVTPANSLANIEDAATKFGYSSLPVSASFTIITSPSLDMKLAAAEAHSITINPQENAYNPKSSQDNAFPTLPSLSSLEKALNEAALSLQTISALTLPDLPSTTKPGIDDMASATSQTKPTNAFEAEVKTPSSASRQVHFGSIEYLFFKASDAVNVQHRGATHHEEVASPPLSPQFPLRTFHHNGNISFLEEFPDNIRQLLAESPSVNVNEEVQTQTPGMTTSDSVDTISSEGSFTSIDLNVIETEEATIMNAQVIPQATASPTLSDLSPGMSWLSAFYQGPSALRPIPSPTLDNPVPSPLQLSFPADIQDEKNEKSESMCREEVPPALSSADSARVMTPSSVLSASASGTMLDINSSLDKKAADQTNEREKQETSTTTQGEDSTNGIIGSMMKRASWLNIFMSRSS